MIIAFIMVRNAGTLLGLSILTLVLYRRTMFTPMHREALLHL